MKNLIKNKLIYFILIFVVMICACQICMAADVDPISEDPGTTPISDEGDIEESYEFIASDLFEFNTDVTVDQIIDGNAFICGSNVTISSEIGGDVFVFADTLTFTDTAYVYGSIFTIANNFTMNGLAYDIYGSCGNFTLGSDAGIARDIKIIANNTYINGTVNRDAYISTNTITFPEGATDLIGGNLNYSSENEISIPEGIVTGNISFSSTKATQQNIGDIIISYVNTLFSAVLYTLAITLLAMWLAPKFTNKAPLLLKKKAPLSLGIGLLSTLVLIAAPVFFIFLTYGLGSSVSFAAIAIFILALTISKAIFSIAAAKLLATKLHWEKPYLFVLLSLIVTLVISLIGFIPYIGGIAGFVVTMLGFGILVLSLIYKKDIEDNSDNANIIEDKSK